MHLPQGGGAEQIGGVELLDGGTILQEHVKLTVDGDGMHPSVHHTQLTKEGGGGADGRGRGVGSVMSERIGTARSVRVDEEARSVVM